MALFPPIVASSMPAFAIDPTKDNNEVKIYYTLSEYSSSQIENISTVHVSVRNQASNVSLIAPELGNILIKTPEQSDTDKALNRYYITIQQTDLIKEPNEEGEHGHFNPELLYKVQLRFSSVEKGETESIQNFFSDNIKYFSEWSTVCIIKPIVPPQFYIDEFYFGDNEKDIYKESSINNFYYNFADFTGVYNPKDSHELLKAWRLRLLDVAFDEKEIEQFEYLDQYIIQDSGWNIISANNYSSNTEAIVMEMSLPYEFEQDQSQYKLLYEIKTYNDYTAQKFYSFQYYETKINKLNPAPSGKELYVNEEQGYIKIKYTNSDPITGNLILRRKDSIRNIWEDLKNFQAHNELSFTYYDFTPQSGIQYQYLIQSRDARGRRGATELIGSVVSPEWEHPFLLEKSQQNKRDEESFDIKQLKLKYDFQISSYKTNISENKTDTIGSQYPFIRRNGSMYYRSFPITGTITHYMDNVKFFTSKNYSFIDTDQNKYDYVEERKFREQVEKFLYNMKPKLYKSTQEGNILIKLMEVSLTPKTELDRLIYTFSATAYEIDEPTISNLNKYGIISIGVFNPVVSFNTNTIGQLTSFQSDDAPIGNVFKGGQDIIGVKNYSSAPQNSIAKRENYKVGIEGNVLDDFRITYLRLTIESQPYLIIEDSVGHFRPYDDIEDGNNPFTGSNNSDDIDFTTPVLSKLYQIESTYNTEKLYLGTLFEINGKQIIISYPNNVYELKEEFLNLPSSTTIIPAKDTIMSVDYTLAKRFVQDTSDLPKRISIEKRIGQIYGSYSPNINLISEIKNKYNLAYSELNESTGKMDTVSNRVSSFSSITFDTDPNVVFNIVLAGESDTNPSRFIINETGELTIDSDFSSIKVKGINISKKELNKEHNAYPQYPISKDLVKIGNQYYIYYKKQWRKAEYYQENETFDIQIPVELMLFYTVTVESDYF